jgi:EmrB/QacA subfamily drug resistance transporter
MSEGWPGFVARWLEHAGGDRRLRALGTATDVAFTLRSGEDVLWLHVRDGVVAEHALDAGFDRRVDFGLAAPAAVWQRLWAPVPPPRSQGLFALLSKEPAFSVEGSRERLAQAAHVVARLLSLARGTPEAADDAGAAPPDLSAVRGRYVRVALAVFGVATALAGLAEDMPWMIAARVVQGAAAALMMPTSVAIVSSVFPRSRSGTALGVLAGGSAFFAALGPVLGGLLTSIDWRLVFWINVPLALAAAVLALRYTPDLRPAGGSARGIDFPGAMVFALVVGAIVFGLSQGGTEGWGDASVVIPLIAGVAGVGVFVAVELRTESPLVEFRLLRHLNFLAANLSQMLAGMIELGLGFLLPYLLLLVIGVDPAIAGLALIPATVPIVLAGPLAGRAFDRVGGRVPLVAGYLVLAASGVALAVGAGAESVGALVPGLLLQGIGLGVVLTVNDPTGLTSVPEEDQGQAAGMINTSEQLGGALGIAVLTAIELNLYRDDLFSRLADRGIRPTPEQIERGKEFVFEAERVGLKRAAEEARDSPIVQAALDDLITAHVAGFSAAFYCSAAIALAGAVLMFALVRRRERTIEGPVFGRRSRWVLGHAGLSPGLTRKPPQEAGD